MDGVGLRCATVAGEGPDMRITGVFLLVLLLAAAIVLYLQGRSAEENLNAVASVAADLREAGVEGRALDRAAASRAIRSMEELVERPDEIAGESESLEEIAGAAAAWADAADAASPELTAAVAIRGAADRINNLQRGQEEKLRQLDDALGK